MNDRDLLRVLILEDNAADAELVVQELRRAGVACLPVRVDSEAAFLAALEPAPDLIVAAYQLPGYGAVEALRALASRDVDVPVIVVSRTSGDEAAILCLREGATDYLLKERLGWLGQAASNAIAHARLRGEQRRMAEALRASEERYRLLFDESPYLMWVVEAGSLRFLEVNRKAVGRYGYSRDEFLAMTLHDVRQPAAIPGTLEATSAELAEEPQIGRGRHRTKAGELLDVSVASRPVDFAGRRALLAVIEDVSERHRQEAQLRQAQKMEAVGQLAGGVAHDFNNLLTIILGYAGLVAARLEDRPELHRQIEEVVNAGERGAALARQLLAFSRQLPLQPRIVDINAVVAGVETMLRRLIGEHVELAMRLQATAGRVLVDPGLIEQVIVNLAVNARDAMPGGGGLVIETADVEVDVSLAADASAADGASDAGGADGVDDAGGAGVAGNAGEAGVAGARPGSVLPGPQVLLAVSDSGTGMDAATRARIFEPFFTTKEVGKGTGLGLATVLGIVQQSGGRIEVTSKPGQGSSFKIYLPRAAGAAGAPEPASALKAERPGGAETVLVLEDEPALRELVRTLLESDGYTVLVAEGVAAALALAERHRGAIRLLLTDVVMPGLSGPEAAARLLAVQPEVRVLYMSGYAGDPIGRRGLLPAGAPLLIKPFTAASLLRMVREVLAGVPEAG